MALNLGSTPARCCFAFTRSNVSFGRMTRSCPSVSSVFKVNCGCSGAPEVVFELDAGSAVPFSVFIVIALGLCFARFAAGDDVLDVAALFAGVGGLADLKVALAERVAAGMICRDL